MCPTSNQFTTLSIGYHVSHPPAGKTINNHQENKQKLEPIDFYQCCVDSIYQTLLPFNPLSCNDPDRPIAKLIRSVPFLSPIVGPYFSLWHTTSFQLVAVRMVQVRRTIKFSQPKYDTSSLPAAQSNAHRNHRWFIFDWSCLFPAKYHTIPILSHITCDMFHFVCFRHLPIAAEIEWGKQPNSTQQHKWC